MEAGDFYTGDLHPAKRRRRDSSTTVLLSVNKKQKLPRSPPSPLSDYLEKNVTPHSKSSSELENRILNWIPPPPDIDELEVMSQPASKRSRSQSTDRGRPRSVSSDASTSSRDAKSSAYKDVNYVTMLETKGCFMYPSTAGPIPEDITLCERLLRKPIETPDGTLFDDEFIQPFHNTLRNRSESRLLVDLHPLLIPSAENLFIRGREELRHVIDGYNDPWLKTEPIYGPKPQPDHARGLKWSIFSIHRDKLGLDPNQQSLYAVREEMYFPYLTAEIKCGNQALEYADRQNMHSMCIALRAVVSLARAAGCLDTVHRRLLGFSISHELDGARIYGYYPEIDEDRVQYFRWTVKRFDIWTQEDKWLCYRFVENLDREFLPVHIDRLMRLLDEIPDSHSISVQMSQDSDIGSPVSRIGSQERSAYSRAASSQNRGLQAELRSMIQSLQQQLEEQKSREERLSAEQKAREEKLLAQMEQQRIEQKAREEKLLAQMEEQRVEQKAREEKLLAQMEEQKVREEKLLNQLFALLEQKG